MKLGIVMDPIDNIHFHHDSSLALLWEAAARGWELYYFEPEDIFLQDGSAYGDSALLEVFHDPQRWFSFKSKKRIPLAELDLILMRKDPPFDMEFLYLTYILEQAEREGVVVVNKAQSLRDANEKLMATWFPTCTVPSIVTSKMELLHEFRDREKDIVCKPLDVMGGRSVFRLRPEDPNASVVFSLLTENETMHVMAQRFIPEIVEGDKRIFLVNGEAIPYALARIPQGRDWRGNMNAGAKPVVQPLTPQDQAICAQIGPVLHEKGIYLAGIDVIGNYLTEINITSPTCIRELDEQCQVNICGILFDHLETLV